MRILLIEDDQATADFVQKGLREVGHVVEHVTDGELGLPEFNSQMHHIETLEEAVSCT